MVKGDDLDASERTNAAVSMALSGARGSMDNLTMMAGSIGQAKVRGSAWSEATTTVSCLTSSGVTEVRDSEDSSNPRSSVA